jgi:hypothetical protein
MAKLESRGFSAADAEEFRARCLQPHRVQWKADVYKWGSGGSAVTIAKDIPIVGGRLTMDSSDPYRRQVVLEIGGGESWAPVDDTSPLTPFGQRIYLFCRIDKADGTNTSWLKMGEFWITSNVFERPSTILTVEASDYSEVVDGYLHMSRKSYVGHTVGGAITGMVQAALPNGGWSNVVLPNAVDNTRRRVTKYVADAGRGRWECAEELASKYGIDIYFNSNGDLTYRQSLSDSSDVDDTAIRGVGPDIGTSKYPVAIIKGGASGNLIAMTSTVTRDGGANGVRINMHSVVTKKVNTRKKDKKGKWIYKNVDVDVNRHKDALQTSGPAKWGDSFGYLPVVISEEVDKITTAVQVNRQARANALLRRRRGLIRYIDLDILPRYDLEPDDIVRIDVTHTDAAGVVTTFKEFHYIQRCEFDLTGGPLRLRTRQLNVTDLGN